MTWIVYEKSLINLQWAKHIDRVGDKEIWITFGPDFRETGKTRALKYSTTELRDKAFLKISRNVSAEDLNEPRAREQYKVWMLIDTTVPGKMLPYSTAEYDSPQDASIALIRAGNPRGVIVKEEIRFK